MLYIAYCDSHCFASKYHSIFSSHWVYLMALKVQDNRLKIQFHFFEHTSVKTDSPTVAYFLLFCKQGHLPPLCFLFSLMQNPFPWQQEQLCGWLSQHGKEGAQQHKARARALPWGWRTCKVSRALPWQIGLPTVSETQALGLTTLLWKRQSA